jgi:hypothetical protein
VSDTDLLTRLTRTLTWPEFTGWQVAVGDLDAPHGIQYRDGDPTTVDFWPAGARIDAPWQKLRDGAELLYAGLPYMELQRQSQGYVTAHAACVAFPQGAVLLLGVSGAGKTVTALELCLRHGGRLVGNDLVMIGIDPVTGELTAQGGTKYMFLRYESIRRNHPQLLRYFGDGSQGKPDDGWLRKLKFVAEDLGVECEHQPVPIVGTYMVHVDEQQLVPFQASADNVTTRLFLAENFARYIRGTCLSLLAPDMSYMGYIPSMDTPTLFDNRTRLIDRLTHTPPIKYISGRVHDVAAKVAP